jgi:2-oxo-3-(phosphooxy)propyl 3-oxoalkanoate synthase
MTQAPEWTAEGIFPATPLVRALTFSRTVDRAQVHRAAISEVFITDLVELGADVAAVGAQLPVGHHFFLDTIDAEPRYDVAILAECARQASTCVAHNLIGVPAGWTFLMMSTSFEMSVPAPVVLERPTELSMLVRADATRRGGAVRTVRTTAQLYVAGAQIAVVTGTTRYVTVEEYEFLRFGDDERPHLLSTGLIEAGADVEPSSVGRRRPENVLLADVRQTATSLTAALRVPSRHATIFDHPLDHFPGMALIEAAGQAGRLVLGAEFAGSVRGFRAEFGRFAELDPPVGVEAGLIASAPAQDPRVRVEFVQNGAAVACVDVDLVGSEQR